MNNANFIFREPQNEPVYSYAPGTPERKLLQEELDRQYNQVIEIPLIIGGKEVKTGKMGKVVMPTEHKHVLANYHKLSQSRQKRSSNGNRCRNGSQKRLGIHAMDSKSFHNDESSRIVGNKI